MKMAPHIIRSSASVLESKGCRCNSDFQQASDFGFALVESIKCSKCASGFTELYVAQVRIYMIFYVRSTLLIHTSLAYHARTRTTRNYLDFRYAGVSPASCTNEQTNLLLTAHQVGMSVHLITYSSLLLLSLFGFHVSSPHR